MEKFHIEIQKMIFDIVIIYFHLLKNPNIKNISKKQEFDTQPREDINLDRIVGISRLESA